MVRKLEDSVECLPGVGPKKTIALNKLGINTIEDLLTYYPFRYDNLAAKSLSEISEQEKVTIKGTVASEPTLIRFGRKKNRLNFRLIVENQVILVTFFNQPYLKEKVQLGNDIAIYGRYNIKRQSFTGMKIIPAGQSNDFKGVYRASKEIKANQIEKLIKLAFDEYEYLLNDIVPLSLRNKYRLETRKQMIHDMHFPQNKKQADLARRSAIFEEFFRFQIGLQFLKKEDKKNSGLSIKYDNEKLKKFIESLPFELTNAQKHVVNEICFNLRQPEKMNRLLQGDVGSGKTIVAAIAMYAVVTAGYQAALMVPTEILAQQHAEKLAKLFMPLGINVGLMTSTTTSKVVQKRELLKQLKNNTIQIVVGTHALIQNEVEFAKLGLVITDEQHRFGVNQRKLLREKGTNPDVLAMTATPIPRTLAITSYGEMDVSIINELPSGRKAIDTKWIRKKQLNEALSFIRQQLDEGAQAYVVSPLIEESEMMDLQNAEEVFEKLKKYFGEQYRIGLLHGKLKPAEKENIMKKFVKHEYDILVSTTVIEVGVDVPNASVMMILDADRFGLAQLHQLRGRVGRGSRKSYCFLVADPTGDYGKERMKTMVDTLDGFVIAQRDLELRGPGDVLGTAQAGLPEFKVGDPVRDLKILQIAQQEAARIINDPNLKEKDENFELLKFLKRKINWNNNLD
ncbi:ATP-dependent DNA helicase RecG [Ligilactobacillus cholophilus]|uniref:ATP-dependent DNA helicase RecG n=1 Tax=Ligilactobacillus cholophilus TaxID=3050131 RepID=UPI0025AF8223|nr:ATP-dependent DNA helicase RecG [Ligilactobacillus cholophilus]